MKVKSTERIKHNFLRIILLVNNRANKQLLNISLVSINGNYRLELLPISRSKHSPYSENTNSIATIRHARIFRLAGECLRRDATLATRARSTLEKFIYLRFRRWPRERAIYPTGSIASVAGPRRPSSSLRNKGSPGGAKPRLERLIPSAPFRFSLSRRIEWMRRAFYFRFSFARQSHRASRHGVLQDVFYFDPAKGGRRFFFVRMYDTREPSSPR